MTDYTAKYDDWTNRFITTTYWPDRRISAGDTPQLEQLAALDISVGPTTDTITGAAWLDANRTHLKWVRNGEQEVPYLELQGQAKAYLDAAGIPVADYVVPEITAILSQDLMAQLTPTDTAYILIACDNEAAQAKADVAAGLVPSAPLNALWAALQAQKDPMLVANARFLAGWGVLRHVLGADRMAAVATALGVTVT